MRVRGISKIKLIRRAIIGAALIFSTLLLAGTSEVLVTSHHSGQNIYLIGVASDSGSSNLKPGLYGLDRRSAKEILLMPGQILGASRAFNGVLGQFSDLFLQNESIAVIDGWPTIFSAKTREDNKKSFVRIGGDGHLVLDATNRRPVKILPVDNINDVSIFIGTPNEQEGYQLFLISLRQPNGFGGSGLTIAGLLKKSVGNSNAELELVGNPLVIDYEYYKEGELDQLVSAYSPDRVISVSHLHALASPRPYDDELLSTWRKSLSQYIHRLRDENQLPGMTTQEVEFSQNYVPEYSLTDTKLHLLKYPHVVVSHQPFFLIQRVDPLTENFLINIELNEGGSQRFDFAHSDIAPTAQGRIGYSLENGGYEAYPFATIGLAKSEAVLVMINQRPHLVFDTSGERRPRVLDLSAIIDDEIVDATGVRFVKPISETRTFRNTFLISFRGKALGEHTFALSAIDRNGAVSIEGHLFLDQRMKSEQELQNRLHESGETENGILVDRLFGDILFDDQSPTEIVKHQRIKRSLLKTPLVNITATLNERPGTKDIIQSYLTSIDSEVIVPGYVTYEKYDNRGAKKVQTGLVILNKLKGAAEKEVIVGDLLRVGPVSALKSVLDSKEVSPPKTSTFGPLDLDFEKHSPFKIWAVALDRKMSKEEPKTGPFSSVIFAGPGSYRSEDYTTNHMLVDVPGDIQRLVGVKIIVGQRERYGNISVLYFFRKMKPGEKSNGIHEKGGVFAVNFDVHGGLSVPKSERFSGATSKWLSDEEINPSEIKYRMVADAAGDIYWINNPETDRLDYEFKVTKIAMKVDRPIYPNRSGERTHLLHDEVVGEDSSNQMFFSSRWLLYSKANLEVHFDWFKNFAKNFSDQKVGEGDNLFPRLEAYLENRASTSAPKMHEVILVEPSLKEAFLQKMMGSLPFRERKLWSLSNKKLEIYAYRPKAIYRETVEELDKIRRASDHRKVLVGDLGEILAADQVEISKFSSKSEPDATFSLEPTESQTSTHSNELEEAGGVSDKIPHEVIEPQVTNVESRTPIADEIEFPVSRMMLLASEGDRVPLDRIRGRLKMPVQIPMMIVATIEEWKVLNEAFHEESKSGAFSGFRVNTEFLTSGWTLWSPKVAAKASKDIVELTKVPVSKDQYQVFSDLERILEESATFGGNVSHRILVVPDELKNLVRRLVLSRWATDSKKLEGPWSHSNPNLALFQIRTNDGAISQEVVTDNFEAMRGASQNRRAVLLGDMAEILKVGRPSSTNSAAHYSLVDRSANAEVGVTALVDENGDLAKTSNGQALPHLAWLLASEGHFIQPKRQKNWSLGHEYKKKISMLIFATEKEMAQLESDTVFEQRFTNLKSEFEITHLQIPSRESRQKMVDELFKSPDIAGLNYSFEHENFRGEEAKKQLINLMVSRIEQISRSTKVEPTSAFLKVFAELKRVLTEDPKVRQARVLDRKFFERLYRRTFPMPLGFDILSADDPLLKLKDSDQAAIALQEKGYIGPMEIKRTAIETVTSQTRSGDAGRQIPSSIIVYGDTSTGKTFLFKTLMDYLGLKPYNFDKPSDDAGYIVIKAEALADNEQSATPTKMSVQRALAHLEHFLTMPNGYRGFVLFDDLHEGTATVRKELISFIQKMQEAEGGVLRLRKRAGSDPKAIEFVEVPVRNINLWMTLNPQPNKKVLKEYVDWEDTKNLDKFIVAALSGEGVQINPSFVARWAMKLNLDSFPREAKLTGLVDRLKSGAAQEFSSNPRLTLVTPDVLDLLAEEFGEANAREFLTAAASSILTLSEEAPKAPIYLLQPNHRNIKRAATDQKINSANGRDRSTADANLIREVLRKQTILRPVTLGDMASKVELMSYMIDGFRVQIYHSLIAAAQQSVDLNRNLDMRKREMPALFMGIVHNIAEFPSVPLQYVRSLPTDLGARTGEDIREFDRAMNKSVAENSQDFLRVKFGNSGSQSMDVDSFLNSSTSPVMQRSRKDVMSETAEDAKKILEVAMASFFRTKNLHSRMTVLDWAEQIPNEDPRKKAKEAGDQLLQLYFNFSANLFSSDLAESSAGANGTQILDYDRVRLFLMCVDKAIVDLPWAQWSQFMLSVVDHSVTDVGFGLSSEIQKVMFESVFSPLTTAAPESIIQLAETNREFREFRDEKTHLQNRFNSECSGFLSDKGYKK